MWDVVMVRKRNVAWSEVRETRGRCVGKVMRRVVGVG